MYSPPAYREDRQDVLHGLMREWSFATIVSSGDDGLLATQLPFLLDEDAGRGRLVTHLARNNPQWRHFESGREVLVVFQGPHAFVSPSWYDNRRAFPTWNYTAVHAYGRPTITTDPQWLRALLRRVIDTYDTPLGGPWRFDDMPESEILPRLKAIVGVEIAIDRLEGKLKLNQDKSQQDRDGVVAALGNSQAAGARETADAMTRFVPRAD